MLKNDEYVRKQYIGHITKQYEIFQNNKDIRKQKHA